MAHETGGFTIVRESLNYDVDGLIKTFQFYRMNPKLAQKHGRKPSQKANQRLIANTVYADKNRDPRNRLGNVHEGDGYAYRGGGFLQTTGRYNYAKVGAKIGVDLENNPSLIEDPLISLKAALVEWNGHNLNRYADTGKGAAISRAINRGNPASTKPANGEADRAQWVKKAFEVFPGAGKNSDEVFTLDRKNLDDVLELGDFGQQVKDLQYKLAELGYVVGARDGAFGKQTRRAVIEFQDDNGLIADGRAGPDTLETLRKAEPKSGDTPERQLDSLSDLAAKGSRTAQVVETVDKVAKTGGAVVVGVSAADYGDLPSKMQEWTGSVTIFQSFFEVIVKFGGFIKGNIWIIAVLAAIAAWFAFKKIGEYRLEDHQTGKHKGV